MKSIIYRQNSGKFSKFSTPVNLVSLELPHSTLFLHNSLHADDDTLHLNMDLKV